MLISESLPKMTPGAAHLIAGGCWSNSLSRVGSFGLVSEEARAMAGGWTETEFRQELAEMGEAKVRRSVEAGRWGGPADDKQTIAKTWLEERDEAKREAKFQASLAIQRDMLTAAQEAATAAGAQAATARWALAIAIVAVLVSVGSALLGKP
jgi:hypothetical protein